MTYDPMDIHDLMGTRTIADVLGHWTARQPDKEFLCFLDPQGKLWRHTWADFSDIVQELRPRLASHGVKEQAVVISLLPNSPAFHAFWFATSCNGGIYLPMDVTSGPNRIRQLVEFATPRVVVTCSEALANARQAVTESGVKCDIVVTDHFTMARPLPAIEGLAKAGGGAPPQPASSNDTAGLIQTSGTTGVPKLVEITHANYLYTGESMSRNLGMNASDRNFIALPLFHSGAQFFSTMPALVTGGSIGYVQSFSARSYIEQAVKTDSTVGVMLAPPLRMILNRAIETAGPVPRSAGRMRQIMYGQKLTPSEYDKWEEIYPTVALVQCYGSTEAVALPVGRAPWDDLPREAIGRPMLERQIKLIAEDGSPAGDGPGQICVKGVPGRTIMKGYYRNADATALAIKDGWFHTGDIARRGERGEYHFVARAQHIIRRGGENISLPEVELLIRSCPTIEDVAARGDPDPILDEKLVVFVIPKPGFTREGFMEWCAANIGRKTQPDQLVVLKEFLRTGVGRVRVKELPTESVE